MNKLLKNSAQCKNCKQVLVSNHRHDFVVCKCFTNDPQSPGIYVDGGLEYIRRGGNLQNVIELSEYKDE